ncbi:hypothetical protein ACO2Q0_16800 [Phenylobacterium sp. VNQ135]|uniref:hypothetical protein n=1 Tax=Phenylobacterium sp. VNQ135 TaxID=3400922 RepID=UPI003C12A410
MSRSPLLSASLALALTLATPAQAQPVEVAPLAAPDAFSTAGRDTGLPTNLWQGASAATLAKVLPLLATKPLSPAAAQLARRVLATGAAGPAGVGDDPAMIGQRANALIALGDPQAAAAILARAPGLERSAELSQAAAESALLAGDDARACAIAERLGEGRGQTYWLRLRAYCQVLAGEKAAAQLTFDLAQTQARDAIYGRLMAAKLAGAAPGAASLRNGLDYALSRNLGLDVASSKPAPAVAAAMAPAEPTWTAPEPDPSAHGFMAAADQAPGPTPWTMALIHGAGSAQGKERARYEGAALLMAALSPDLGVSENGDLAGFSVPAGKAPAGRTLALSRAVAAKASGETALLALWTAAEAGAGGVALGDRIQIVQALRLVGLADEANAFAAEGLAGLK